MRRRLGLLFVLALVPALIASVLTSLDERARLRAEAGATTLRLARLLAAHFEGTLASTYELVRVLDHHPGVLAGGRTCEETFDEILATANTTYSGFALSDATGKVVCSSPRVVRPPDLGRRAAFKRVLDGGDFVLGETEIGPLSGKVVVLALHGVRSGSRLDGVVTAGVDLTSLSALASRINLPGGATFTVVNNEGVVLVRYPDPAAWIGRDTADSPVTRRLSRRSGGGTFEDRGLDGVSKVFGYAPLEAGGTRFVVVVALAADDLMNPADRVLYRNLAGLATGAVVAFGLVAVAAESWLRRPIARMLDTAHRIEGGQLDARVAMDEAPGEFGALARGIDDMADSLQRRDRDVAALSRRVLEVQEEERRAIARELHDEIGQALTAIKLILQAQRMPGADSTPEWLGDGIAIADRVLRQVRSLSLNLRPAMLDHLGLGATLRWYVAQESARTGLPIRCDITPPDLRLAGHQETTLFRIAQEALTNLLRHSDASAAGVEVAARDGLVELTVRDNGRGFDVAAARQRARRGGSLGILGMEERAMLAGGQFELHSSPSGTEMRVRLHVGAGTPA